MPTYPQRRSPRLPADAYAEQGRAFAVTVGTSPRRPVFTDLPFGHACVAELQTLRDATGVPIYAYCLMPDHAHLLAAVSEDQPLPQIVQRWKSRCYQARRRLGHGEPFWQRSFHDRAVRREDDLLVAARYVLANPVRAGLVADWRDYPLCGSLEWDLDELV